MRIISFAVTRVSQNGHPPITGATSTLQFLFVSSDLDRKTGTRWNRIVKLEEIVFFRSSPFIIDNSKRRSTVNRRRSQNLGKNDVQKSETSQLQTNATQYTKKKSRYLGRRRACD
jgi:hypothetical protein